MTETYKALPTNLNQYIYFKPNDKAKDTYRKYMAVLTHGMTPELLKRAKHKMHLVPDDDGFCKLQMWEFMKIFGSGFHLGGPPDIEMEVMIEVLEEPNFPLCTQCGKPCYSGGLCCSPTCYSSRNKGQPSLYARSLSPN